MAQTSVPLFDVVLPDDLETGVTAISLVLNPAIQHPFVALSEEPVITPRVHLSMEPMKQVVTGPALVPDQPIFRLSGDNKPFYIRFSADVVEQVSRRFLASQHLHTTTDEHAIVLSGNTVVESWIVTDPAADKSTALGLNVPAGTWMLSVHIPDAAYWNEQVVSGNRTGFSIEAMLDLAEPDLFKAEPQTPAQPTNVTKPATQTRKKNLFQRLMAAVFLSIEKVVDGPEIEIDEDTKAVYQIDADGNRGEVLPDGNYTLESGDQLIVANGKQTSATDAASSAEATAPVEAAAEVSAEEPVAESTPAEPGNADLQAELDLLKAKIAELETARTSLMATNTELQTKLAAEPAAKPVKLAAAPDETTLTPAQMRLARARALR